MKVYLLVEHYCGQDSESIFTHVYETKDKAKEEFNKKVEEDMVENKDTVVTLTDTHYENYDENDYGAGYTHIHIEEKEVQ